MSNSRHRAIHDTDEIPFEHKGKQLVFAHHDGTFYCYNVVNSDGNFRGTHQSVEKLHN